MLVSGRFLWSKRFLLTRGGAFTATVAIIVESMGSSNRLQTVAPLEYW
jgi:hypothetical protein